LIVQRRLGERAAALPPPAFSAVEPDRQPSRPQPQIPANQRAGAAPSPPGPRQAADRTIQLLRSARRQTAGTAEAHKRFLALSRELADQLEQALALKARLAGDSAPAAPPGPDPSPEPVFDRRLCMEFAVGSVARVLGPAFAVVDTYPVRVRLPDEPLMLVDRILAIEGTKGGLGSGRIVTEHDVLPGSWYLDGGRAPVCISVEAGQADLFLSAYLGIDLKVRGRRAYRLLDAVVRFHRHLPRPGETIRYDIHIDRFVRQGETYLFLFRFQGTIDGHPLITMENGCAGFFTAEEVDNSGGILLTEAEQARKPGRLTDNWQPPVPLARESYDEAALTALRDGDLGAAFGPGFDGIALAPDLRLPRGRMHLIDRVAALDPAGGRYGLGMIRAEADIHPDDWFLTCHFVDDMVMPGTLMYECCAHTLRVFLQRLGWVAETGAVAYEPVLERPATLKCRGPVTPATRQVDYQVEISEIGYGPEPYALADAHMFADGRHIVMFKGMSLKVTGLTRESVADFWRRRQGPKAPQEGLGAMDAAGGEPPASPLPRRPSVGPSPHDPTPFGRRHFAAYTLGNPSEAFGPRYAAFDRERIIARLPAPPYAFLDRITYLAPDPWVLKPDGWVEAEYRVPPEAWYFRADRNGSIPFCVLLEIALQPCGWLAAYAGSPLTSDKDLKFRNLDGQGILHRQVHPGDGVLTTRVRLTKVSRAGDMLIESFDFEVWQGQGLVYAGETTFGFFTVAALAQQVGIRKVPPALAAAGSLPSRFTGPWPLPDLPPLTPDDPHVAADHGPYLPSRALRMIDTVTHHDPEGSEAGLDLARATKTIRPEEWFFKAHFHQDPVCPGSLGIESMIQLMKWVAIRRWPDKSRAHRFALLTGRPHQWKYRGQIVPADAETETCVAVSEIADHDGDMLTADGILRVDGRTIYEMHGFGLRLVAPLPNRPQIVK
jgi:3-hydroxymyristoyl/3-hydroxydecanoyl-(acyl carrier protein) dehydratase